jgi:hypothetical protein
MTISSTPRRKPEISQERSVYTLIEIFKAQDVTALTTLLMRQTLLNANIFINI